MALRIGPTVNSNSRSLTLLWAERTTVTVMLQCKQEKEEVGLGEFLLEELVQCEIWNLRLTYPAEEQSMERKNDDCHVNVIFQLDESVMHPFKFMRALNRRLFVAVENARRRARGAYEKTTEK